MSLLKAEDSKKWINSFVAILSILVAFISIRFLGQMSEWFDLEAKINNLQYISQGVGIAAGLLTFILTVKNKSASTLLNEVYGELLKAVWPDKDTILKLTVGLVISLSIVSGIFVGFDFLFRKLLELIY
jgi:preprotein translocase subunit SecE